MRGGPGKSDTRDNELVVADQATGRHGRRGDPGSPVEEPEPARLDERVPDPGDGVSDGAPGAIGELVPLPPVGVSGGDGGRRECEADPGRAVVQDRADVAAAQIGRVSPTPTAISAVHVRPSDVSIASETSRRAMVKAAST